MSYWTHINCNFRIANSHTISNDEIYKVFEKHCLPTGSEGPLLVNTFIENEHTNVTVFGDLRDYYDFDEVGEWFNECCKEFDIKQAYCQVNDDNGVGKNFECTNLVDIEGIGVNASFRFDYDIDEEDIVSKECSFLNDVKVNVENIQNERVVPSTVVNVVGDLDIDPYIDIEIHKWFNGIIKQFRVRQAFCQVNLGNKISKIYVDRIRFNEY